MPWNDRQTHARFGCQQIRVFRQDDFFLSGPGGAANPDQVVADLLGSVEVPRGADTAQGT
jgi:hypothetical protein